MLWVQRMRHLKKLGLFINLGFISHSTFHRGYMSIASLFLITDSLGEVFMRSVSLSALRGGISVSPSVSTAFLRRALCSVLSL